ILAHTTPFDALEAGICDMVVMPLPPDPVPFHRRFLATLDHVCVVASNGPYASGITREQYESARHIWNSLAAAHLSIPNPPFVQIAVPSLADVDLLVENTDLVATVPEPLARDLRGKVRAVPVPIDMTANLYLFWTDRTHDSLH